MWEVIRRRYRRELKLAALVCGGILIVVCLMFAMRKSPLIGELQRLQEQVTALDSKRHSLEAIPTAPSLNSAELLKQYAVRAKEIEEGVTKLVQSQKIDEAKVAMQSLEALPKQAEVAAKATRSHSAAGPGKRTAEAQQLIMEFQGARESAQTLVDKAKGKQDIIAGAEQAMEQCDQGLVKIRKLLPKRTAPVSEADLVKMLSVVTASLEKARAEINGFLAPPPIPFTEAEATLTIVATSDLAENLVVPMLKAFSGGEVTPASGQAWYYTSKPGVQPVEKVLVKAVAETPIRELTEGRADLLLTDHEITPDEADIFKQRFPDQKLNSRSSSEVVALDALTMLAHSDSNDVVLNAEQAKATAWICGQPGSVEHAAALRFGFQVGETADRPADAVQANRASRGLGLYHKDGRIRCKRLAYTPGGGAPALEPSPFTVASKDYKYAFDVSAHYSPNSRPGAARLINFIISDAGQNVVGERGYVDRRLRGEKKPVDPVVLAVLGRALGRNVTGAVRLSTDIRFPTDDDNLSPRAQADLEQLPAQLARDYPKGRLVILGFTDNVGAAEYNLKLSVKRSLSVAERLKRAVTDVVHTGLGSLLPVDNNDSPDGRGRNRRAEVWVVTE